MSDQRDKLDINKNKDETNLEDDNSDKLSTPNNENLEEESTSKTVNVKTIKPVDSQEDILLNESTSSNKHELGSNEISAEGTGEHRQQQQHQEHVDRDNDNNQMDITQSLNEQSKKVIDPELFYNIDEYIAYPMITENSGIPMNLLTVYHLFGMDVSRRENLQLIENNILCHVFGNYLQLVNMDTNEKRMIRSLNGIGIGAFCIHPRYKYIAIAEKGELPNVGIYQYPDIKLYRILRGGTQTAYSACQFCPNGELLATVGSHSDYMLTIWEWRNEQIMLRCKAYSNEIYHLIWSIDIIGKLITIGNEHIKFWQISTTFTGLKLQGRLGKFDRINAFNIEGITILPDGKVLTNSINGNLLLWEDNLIKVQITRKNKYSCHHNGCIMQIIIDDGELMTIGQDGWIRTWDFETVDTAECSGEGEVYELEPMNELRVGTTANLKHIVKVPLPDSTMWYAQDADGALWKLDLSFSHTSLAPECLEEFHANDIVDCVTSPLTYCAATVGLDGKVCIYDIVQKKILVSRRFPSGGSSLIWSPPKVDPKGKILVVGHQDGVLRVLKFGENPEELTKRSKQFALLDLGQALKPHKSAITSMIYSPSGKLFITGSRDETVFFFSVNATHLSPIGFVNVYAKVVRLEWFYVNNESMNEIIAYLENGCVITVQCPLENEKYDHSNTFALNNLNITKSYQLMSIKSRLDHEHDVANRLAQYNKAKEIRQEIRQMNSRLQQETDEDKQKLDDAEEAIHQGVLSEISDWTPTYPTNPSPLVYGCLDRNEPNQFWISLDDFDKGYIYKCELGSSLLTIDDTIKRIHQLNNESKLHNNVINTDELHKIRTCIDDLSGIMLTDRIIPTEPNKAIYISDKKDSCITCWIFSNTGYRLLIGFNDGVICVQLLDKPYDITMCKGFWMYRLHDNQRGRVNRIAFTYDEKFVLSAGGDGTLFVCELMTEEMQNKEIKEYRARIPSTFDTTIKVDDITDPNTYSIEESKQKLQQDHLMELAEEKKSITRQKLAELKGRFKKLKEQNNRLPERIRLSTEAFNLVPQIRSDLFNNRQAEIDLVYKETAWETEKHRLALEKLENVFTKPLDCNRITVKAFCTGHCVTSIRMNKLSDEYLKVYDDIINIRKRLLTEEKSPMTKCSTQLNTVTTKSNEFEVIKTGTDQFNASIKGARGLRVMQKLHLLEETKRRRAIRRAQWKQLEAMKPSDNYDDPKDTEAIQLAIEKLGDYKLKSSTNYVIPESMKLNTFEVKSKLINLVDHMFKSCHEFNVSLLMLRNKKMKIIEKLQNINKQLQYNNYNLPLNEFGIRLYIEELDEDESPEKKFMYNDEILLNFKKHLENDTMKEQMESSEFITSTTVKMSSSKQLPFTESTLPEERCRLKEPEIVIENCNTNCNNNDNNITQTMNVVWLPLHCLNWDNLHISVPTNSDQMYSLVKPSFRYTFDEVLINHQLDSNEATSGQPTEQQHDVNKSIIIPIYQPIKPDKMSTYSIGDSKLANNEDEDKNLSENNIINQISTVKSSLTPLEMEQQQQMHIKAIYLRNSLLQMASRLVRCFDVEVRLLRHKRYELDVLMKRTELHQYTLYDEYRLLKEFEKSEHVLTEKVKNKFEEKQDITNKVNELTLKIEQKKKDLERLSQREHQIHEEFKTNLNDSHKFIEFLTKVFKKRIKRKKQELLHSGSEEESEESSTPSSSDESSYDEAYDESGTDDAIIMDLDTCPPGCPMEDYERTCSIREKRLDVEEEMAEEKRTLDILRKDYEVFNKKQRIIETILKQAQNELEAFQLEKQRQLNELSIIVILRLDQIHSTMINNQSIPFEMTNYLIFLKSNLYTLKQRIEELNNERKQQQHEKQQAKQHHILLQKYKKLFQKELEDLSVKCDKEMYDKFGRIDDIEKMESIMVNTKLEELTTKMSILQEEFIKEDNIIEAKIRNARDECIEQIRQNTVYLTQLLALFNEHQQLQHELNQAQNIKIGTAQNSSGVVDRRQLKQLVQLAKLQAEEINSLTKEIQQLTR
ncbi:hypothetical protein MN116_006515 [Schistosoma mekongi]|uniref:Cilia- and flagella-associated protein 44 n=1 Tax=Schistosoma mekongi TaxID=38744 RepID=A0AAE1ZC11_SCHME|nr:hypothetical protein MN116_006515 [Schistosoma mekongi]